MIRSSAVSFPRPLYPGSGLLAEHEPFQLCYEQSFLIYYNAIGKVDGVTHMDGMSALSGPIKKGAAVTIGHISLGPKGYKATWKDHLFVHEYGHYIQSQIIGINSFVSASLSDVLKFDHSTRWFETWASSSGANHFNRNYGNDQVRSEDYFDYKAFKNNTPTLYMNPRTQGYNTDKKYPLKPKFHWLDIIPLQNR